jgi:hypothetical protein
MSKMAAAALLAALAVGAWALVPRATHAQVSSGSQIESLLKQLDLTYKQVAPNTYKVVIELQNNETIIVMAEDKVLPWKDRKGQDIHLAMLSSRVLDMPKGFNPPAAMLLKIAEVNDRLFYGSVSISKNQNTGEMSVWRNLSFLLRGADADSLLEYLRQAALTPRELRKDLQGFVEEGK